jgi:hypothetical protein
VYAKDFGKNEVALARYLRGVGFKAADAPSFVEIGRAVAAIGVTKRILVVCQDYGYFFALIWR